MESGITNLDYMMDISGVSSYTINESADTWEKTQVEATPNLKEEKQILKTPSLNLDMGKNMLSVTRSIPTGVTLTRRDMYRNGNVIKKMYRNDEVIYQRIYVPEPEPVPPTPAYSAMPLTFEIISAGTISFKAGSNATPVSIQYKKNDGEWTSITSTTAGTTFNVDAGDIVEFKGNNATYATNTASTYANTFGGTTAIFKAYGNIMSMVAGDNFETATTFTANNVFRNFFYNLNLVDAENLILYATGLTQYCYMGMFGSTQFPIPPALPATTLANSCYKNMFLSATALTTSPDLLAPTLVAECYEGMFNGCSSLNFVRCLATSKGYNTTSNWCSNWAANGTFVKAAGVTWTQGSSSGIPNGWTVIEE